MSPKGLHMLERKAVIMDYSTKESSKTADASVTTVFTNKFPVEYYLKTLHHNMYNIYMVTAKENKKLGQ